jgi:hypothetical protein
MGEGVSVVDYRCRDSGLGANNLATALPLIGGSDKPGSRGSFTRVEDHDDRAILEMMIGLEVRATGE